MNITPKIGILATLLFVNANLFAQENILLFLLTLVLEGILRIVERIRDMYYILPLLCMEEQCFGKQIWMQLEQS